MYNHIVIVSAPYTDTDSPIMAPGALKSVAQELNISTKAFDLNGLVINKLNNFQTKDKIIDFLVYGKIDPAVVSDVVDLFEYMVSKVTESNPELVCISLLHYQCKESTKWLAFLLKKQFPSIKIIIGGPGINDDINSQSAGYAEDLKQSGLIDHYIYGGDGEYAFREFLLGNTEYPGINNTNWVPIENLNLIPYADYNDYDFSLYKFPILGIVGSRGCVRKCTFCDVHETWKKFNWRSAENLFQEMLYQADKYNIRTFKFQDNLVNGNVKEFNELIRLLAEYNNKNPDKKLSWAGYFIFRPRSQMSEEMWQLTAESGAIRLQVGVENLVDKNRFHMKKKFNNEDLAYGLDMAKKYNIGIMMLMMVGYVTETDEDHQETLQWLTDNVKYAGNPITRIIAGGTLAILPNTWLSRNQSQLGITWKDGNNDHIKGKNHLWEIKNTNNTYTTRVTRLAELINHGAKLGFHIENSVIDPQKELENTVVNYVKSQTYRY